MLTTVKSQVEYAKKLLDDTIKKLPNGSSNTLVLTKVADILSIAIGNFELESKKLIATAREGYTQEKKLGVQPIK